MDQKFSLPPEYYVMVDIDYLSRAAGWFIFKPKIPIWVNFGVRYIGKC
jgi:hypothetical protein